MSKQISQRKLVQRIKRKIVRSFDRIKKGYEIVYEEADGCDEHGYKYWVECRNGFSGRSWDINPAIVKSFKLYIKDILENGIEYNRKMYYLDDNLFMQIFPEDLLKRYHIYTFKKNIEFSIKLISEDEFIKVKNNIKNINTIIERINETINNFTIKNRIKAKKILDEKNESNDYFGYLRYLDKQPEWINVFTKHVDSSPRTSIDIFSYASNSRNIIMRKIK